MENDPPLYTVSRQFGQSYPTTDMQGTIQHDYGPAQQQEPAVQITRIAAQFYRLPSTVLVMGVFDCAFATTSCMIEGDVP